jgi:purine-nucleoside phosphorylase
MADARMEKLNKAATTLKAKLPKVPDIALVLGSGLSQAFGIPGEGVTIPWSEIPGFPLPTVAGHAGDFWFGDVNGKQLLLQRGRTHYYEGYSIDDVVFATRLFALIGIKTLIVTNASGAINRDFSAGDLVLITDHINMLGTNPLRGPNLDDLGPRFPDMSAAYSPRLRSLAKEEAASAGIALKEGVYLATLGPSYESPAEIRAFRALGADLVGMSTVPEVIAACHAGMEVLGISCATNLAAGVNPEATLSHAEVIETTKRVGDSMRRLIIGIIERA